MTLDEMIEELIKIRNIRYVSISADRVYEYDMADYEVGIVVSPDQESMGWRANPIVGSKELTIYVPARPE